MKRLKVLIGCEESQVVCKAFRDKGHEAYSCDLIETRGKPEWHIQGDIMDNLEGWDLIILHPDCTAMAVCANSTYAKGKEKHYKRIESVEWTINLWKQAIKQCSNVVLENPASVIFPHLRKLGAHIQYIQPFEYGHPEQKKTGLALHGVKPITETTNVYNEMMTLPRNQRERIHFMSPGPNRKRDRSRTFEGIAQAMANQWG